MNPVLVRLLAERAEQVQFIDNLLARVETEGRDLVDAEVANLQAARQRIARLDEQIKPLQEFEELRAGSAATAAAALAGRGAAAGSGGTDSAHRGVGYTTPAVPEYRSAGEFIVDYLRAVGQHTNKGDIAPDSQARDRVNAAMGRDVVGEARALANATTGDVSGVLPKPIIGQIETDLDAARPFVSSIGVRPLTQPGKTFSRPVVSQHTDVSEQLAEKTEVISRKLIIGEKDFTKRSFGGAVDVSRQTIDWSDPSAWDAIVTDLQLIYGANTEDAAAVDFETAVTASVPVADASVEALIDALYAAAVLVVQDPANAGRASALRLPDKIWTSVDMWGKIGAALSKAALSLLQSPGSASPTSVEGSILTLPRIMVPGFADGTVIIGRSTRTEFYEERIGLLSAVEPRLLGVEVAYGGYIANGTLDASSFAKLDAPVTGP